MLEINTANNKQIIVCDVRSTFFSFNETPTIYIRTTEFIVRLFKLWLP